MSSQKPFLKITCGTYVTNPRMWPVLAVQMPYTLSTFSAWMPSFDSVEPLIKVTTGPSFLTSLFATGAYGIGSVLSKHVGPRFSSRRRHNKYLSIGAASTAAVMAGEVAFPPVSRPPVTLPDAACTLTSVALTTALLWSRRPKAVKQPAKPAAQIIPA